MLELVLVLLGAPLLRRNWGVLALIGILWLALGIFFFLDAFIEDIRIPPTYFAIPLLLDGAVSLIAGFFGSGAGRWLRLVKAALFLLIGLLIIDSPWHSDMVIGILVGIFLIVDAAWRAASAVVVRYAGWHGSLLFALVESLFGVWSLIPWPTQWAAEIGSDVGLLLIVSAIGIGGLALRIRSLSPGMPVSTVLSRGWPKFSFAAPGFAAAGNRPAPAGEEQPVVVHVWTPTGKLARLNHGISRYIAALDEHGAISTGHAALELAPDLYVSHYPAVEIERSPSDFARILRATPDNDVPGVFQPSYSEESANWCPSSFQVQLSGLNAAGIRTFWSSYRRDNTYNLTNRNCSSVVAKALDAGLEGLFEPFSGSPFFLFRLVMRPEVWVAGMIRHQAAGMAWTPGLVLDYARALTAVLSLPGRYRQSSNPPP